MTCLRIGELFPLCAGLIVQTLRLLVLPPQLRPQVFLHDFAIKEPRVGRGKRSKGAIQDQSEVLLLACCCTCN